MSRSALKRALSYSELTFINHADSALHSLSYFLKRRGNELVELLGHFDEESEASVDGQVHEAEEEGAVEVNHESANGSAEISMRLERLGGAL